MNALRSPAASRRILYVVTEDWYFWSHRVALARAARDAGFEVHVVTHVGSLRDRIEAEGIRVHPSRLRRRWSGVSGECRAWSELVRLYRDLHPALVHHVALKPVVYGSLAALFSGRPPVVNALAGRGFIFTSGRATARALRPILRTALWLLLDRANGRVLVQNAEDGEFLASGGLAAKERIALVRGSGVDTARYRPLPEPPGDPVVAMVSRMLREKGVEVLVEAARILRRSPRPCRIRLVGPLDPHNPGAVPESELTAWNASGVVEWAGPAADVREIWRNAHIAVLPTHYGEGLPKTLLEAAACGRPLVATDVPGCKDIVIDGQTGLRVPPRDPEALAAALLRLIDDGALRARLGANARALVEAEFSEERVVAATLAVYRELLTESKS